MNGEPVNRPGEACDQLYYMYLPLPLTLDCMYLGTHISCAWRGVET